MADSPEVSSPGISRALEAAVAPFRRGILRDVSINVLGSIIGALLLALPLAIFNTMMGGWAWLYVGASRAAAMLLQPAPTPPVIYLVLGVSIAVLGFLQWRTLHRDAPMSATVSTLVSTRPGKAKEAISSWVDFGYVFYKVTINGYRALEAGDPYCSKCLGPVTARDGSPCGDFDVYCRCNNEACLSEIKLPMHNRDLKKRAKDTIEALWNRALLKASEPVLVQDLLDLGEQDNRSTE